MRATEFITELFQQSTVPWVWGRRGSDEASASFTVGPQHYLFQAYDSLDDPGEWEIEFAATSIYSNGPSKDKLKYDYPTVVKINDYVRRNKIPNTIKLKNILIDKWGKIK